MSVVVAVRDEDKIWLAADSQVTKGWSKSSLVSKHSFKIFKNGNNVNIGGVGALRDLNIISTADVDFISETNLLKNNITFKNIVRETVPKIFNELAKFNRLYVEDGVQEMESAFIIAYKDSCYSIYQDGCVQELADMFAIGSGSNIAESAYTILRDTELSAKEKAIRSIMSTCERDLFVDYPIIITNTLMDSFEIFDGENYYIITPQGELEEVKEEDEKEEEEENRIENKVDIKEEEIELIEVKRIEKKD